MYNNKYSDQLLPMITPEMLSHYPDQTCEILNKMGRLAQKSSTSVEGGGEGNLEDIVQTSTSYADGGVNIVTAYLSDGTTQDFQIRNGHQGSQGDPGAPGQDATIAVGTTTTLPAGSSATVTDSGTPSAAVLNFGIPKGDTGAAGADGQDGFSPTASVTKVGDTATITITDKDGTTTASVTDGQDGAAATISVGSTTTLPAGSSATVTNSGTSSAAVFDFGIPKGDKGDTGSTGPAGPGVVSGGTTGQVLTKKSGTDYDTEWTTPATYSDFTGATSSIAGTHGLVPAPTTSDPDKFLKGDGTWGTPPGTTYTAGTGIDITGSTIAVDTSTVAMQTDLPTRTSDLINDGADNTSTYVEADELATVATSGSYSDLLDKPTIPTVNDATLTIQKNGTDVQTFTANSSSNKTANITVPTKTSDLTNDGADNTSTYVEADELATVATSGSYTDLSDKPTIPTVNDATLTVTQNGTSKGTFTANSNTNTTIALTDTTYTAGTGINITGTTVAVDTSTVSMKSDYTVKKSFTIDLSAQSKTNFYPVIFARTQNTIDCEIHSEGGSASLDYNQNYIHFNVCHQGWSDIQPRKKLIILQEGAYTATEITIGCIGLGTQYGYTCVWLRGGIRYFFTSNFTAEAKTSTYTSQGETYSVGTNYYGGTNTNVSIVRNPNDFAKDVALLEDIKVNRVENYYTSRPTTANTTATGKGGMFTFQATSSMTTAKPKNDAHIIQLEWDNTGGYDSQIAVNNNGSSPWIAVRAQDGGTWKNWVYLLNDEAGSVKTTNIDALAVTTAKIADNAITAAKLAPGVVNDATLTITKNGSTLGTFTANASSNVTIDVPDTAGPKGDPGKGCPIGTILPYSGTTLPEGYLACDGTAVSRTTYSDLFSAIGTTYGSGDGSTTFNLPNLKGKVPVGQDTNDTSFDVLGETGGEKTHKLTVAEMPQHQHRISCQKGTPGNSSWDYGQPGGGWSAQAWNPNPTEPIGGNGYHNNLQPYIVINYIIKFKDLPNTVAEVKDQYSSSATDVYSANYVNSAIQSGSSNPTGAVITFAGSSAPTGYLLCDGSAVSRTTYADLFTVIGTTYGTGDGSTTFNLPNLKGKVIVGQDAGDTSFDVLGETGGEKTHQLINNELPKLTGTLPHIAYGEYKVSGVFSYSSAAETGVQSRQEGAAGSTSNYSHYKLSIGNNQAHNNLQPYIVLNYIIKT